MICHQAAQIDVRRSMSDPRFDADVNVGGLLNVMQAAVEARSVEHVLFASSGGATYGDTDVIPTPETHPQLPVSHYGAAKAASELYLGVYRANFGITFTALRYSNVYGPRQDPHGEAGVVAIFCGRLLEGQAVHGLRRRRSRPATTCSPATSRARTSSPRSGASTVRSTSAPASRRTWSSSTGTSPAPPGVSRPPEHAPARLGEQRRSCIDPTAAAGAIGWRPEVALADGLARTFEWFAARRR